MSPGKQLRTFFVVAPACQPNNLACQPNPWVGFGGGRGVYSDNYVFSFIYFTLDLLAREKPPFHCLNQGSLAVKQPSEGVQSIKWTCNINYLLYNAALNATMFFPEGKNLPNTAWTRVRAWYLLGFEIQRPYPPSQLKVLLRKMLRSDVTLVTWYPSANHAECSHSSL